MLNEGLRKEVKVSKSLVEANKSDQGIKKLLDEEIMKKEMLKEKITE